MRDPHVKKFVLNIKDLIKDENDMWAIGFFGHINNITNMHAELAAI